MITKKITLLQIKSSFLHLKLLFDHITPLLKVQKTCVDSLKNPGNFNQNGYQIRIVNTRNKTAAITAINIPNKKKTLKLVGPLSFTKIRKTLKEVTLDILVKIGINILNINISWI